MAATRPRGLVIVDVRGPIAVRGYRVAAESST
jgi:hypothetical protein